MTDGAAHPSAPGAETEPRIVAVLDKPGNRRVLRESLAGYCLATPASVGDAGEDDVDLFIVELRSLARDAAALRERREAVAPLLVPVLLVVREQELSRIRKFQGLVEEVLVTPIHRAELVARIETLLKLRRMSRAQHAATEAAEGALAGVNRAFRALSACNEAVLWGQEEGPLLERVCELMISEAGYKLAWVGYAEHDRPCSVRVVAGTERSRAYAKRIFVSWADDEWGQGSVGTSIREGRTVVIPNTARSSRFTPWRAMAREYGFGSVISLPLRVSDQVVGAMVIHAEKSNAFDEQEVRLLERMTENLAYGIQSLRQNRERLAQQRRATYLAYRDPLTGLANRTWLTESLSELNKQRNQGAAVLFLDLDGFKVINDALGHHTGDRLLQEVAARIQSAVRDTDLVARQGGDEFIVLMRNQPRTGEHDAEAPQRDQLAKAAAGVAERILSSIAEPFQLGASKHTVTGSLGISLYPFDSEDAETLLTAADQAMYLAKSAGGNTERFYSRQLSRQHSRRLSFQQQLRVAVERKEFELHYQPIVDVQHGHTVSLEALIRWPQRDGTVVSPAEFLPMAEETGLILPLGRWVIRQAIEDAGQLNADLTNLTVAVNLSVDQFREPDLTRFVAGCLRDQGVAPRAVTFEVTESSMMINSDVMERALEELNEAGHAIALDDFGTGYSSLWRLQELPLSTLKVDKTFLQGAMADTDAVTIMHTIIKMARDLRLDVIGEGVETHEQWALLRQLGCNLAQGFYFHRPQPLLAVRQLLASGAGVASGQSGT